MRTISVFLFFLLLLTGASAQAQSAGAATAPSLRAIFIAPAKGQAVTVTMAGAQTASVLAIDDGTLFDILGKARVGDHLILTVDDVQAPKRIKGIVSLRRDRDFLAVVGYLALAVGLLLCFGALATGFDLRKLIIGADNRYSNSKFQMAAWFFVLFSVYLASLLMLLFGGWIDAIGTIAIPQNLVVLSGLSALTYGAAKAITVTKVENAKANSPVYQAAQGIRAPDRADAVASAVEQIAANKVLRLKVAGAPSPSLRNLVTDDEGCVDLGDCQALFITLLALVLYLIAGYAFLAHLPIFPDIRLPDVDTALLSMFGLGQGAYLAKKAVAPAGQA